MTNLDSVLKSRDITLSREVHLVKAMVFPVVMYGCASWTTKPDRRRIGAFGQTSEQQKKEQAPDNTGNSW